jgi:hypothetical protein
MTATTADQITEGRQQYVFVFPCGCPRSVVEAAEVPDAEAARHLIAPLKSEKKMLDLEGVRVLLVDQAEYEERYLPLMRIRCPHPRAER